MKVNEAIKGYISLHKHDLMSGMQDVAVLASRYQTLQAVSSRVRSSLDRLKKEVAVDALWLFAALILCPI